METYIVSDGTSVKIGKTSNPLRRHATLQTANSKPLRFLLLLDGDLERSLHKQFANHHKRGEWFTLSPAILKFVAETRGLPWYPPFYTWLLEQRQRTDNVGRFALIAESDKHFPRQSNRLYALLRYYEQRGGCDEEQEYFRKIIKYCHGEWRKKIGRTKIKQFHETKRGVEP